MVLDQSVPSRVGSLRSSRLARWLVPIVAAGAVAGVYAVAAPSSEAVPTLPHRTPAQLITAVERSGTQAFSGQVQQVSNFGIPQLPGSSSSASLSWQNLISGTHTARVWVDGASKQRVAVLGDLSEADVVHNGANVWTYTSDTNSVAHYTLPAREHNADAADHLTPEGVASRLLAAITPSTAVSVDTAQRVAGRPAYTLVLRPRDQRSTVRDVQIAVDATKYVPLRLQVFGTDSTSPAFQLGFTSIDFGTPAASTFDFHTPAGATVTKDPFTGSHGRHEHGQHGDSARKTSFAASASARPTTIGSGWTTVAEFPTGLGSSAHLADELTTPVGSSGDKLVHTALINVVITPSGRTFVGAVQPSVLEHLAATTH